MNDINALNYHVPVPEPFFSMLALLWCIGHFVMTWGKLERTAIATICSLSGAEYEHERYTFLKDQMKGQADRIYAAAVI